MSRADREVSLEAITTTLEMIADRLEKFDKALFGNGHPGLIKENEVIKTKMFDYDKTYTWLRGGVFAILFAICGFIFAYGQLVNKVDNLTRELKPPIECKK